MVSRFGPGNLQLVLRNDVLAQERSLRYKVLSIGWGDVVKNLGYSEKQFSILEHFKI